MALPATFVNAASITPHDSNPNVFKAVYVGGAGVVALVTKGNQTVNFTAPAGATLFVECIRVNATNTTATLLVGLT